MEKKKNYLQHAMQATILGVAIVASALIISSMGGRFADQDRFVSVKGLSEREYPADRVVWPIQFKEVGDNLQDISKSADAKIQIIKEFLIENGLTEEEISESVPEIVDTQADRYSSERASYRYIMTAFLTITSNQVDKVRNLMSKQSDLLEQGVALTVADYRYQVLYQYTTLNDIKVEMIEEASKNARASAQQFADDSGSELGKIRNASQGQISISDRDPNSPHIKRIRVVTSVSYFLED